MHYGDVGILVARLGGTIQVTEENDGIEYSQPFSHDSLSVLRSDARVNMTILRKSSQCLALAYFDGRVLNKMDASARGNRAINKFHLELQQLIDKLLNGGTPTDVNLEAPFRTIIATPAQRGITTPSRTNTRRNATNSTTVVAAPATKANKAFEGQSIIRYEAPETLLGLGLEEGINVGAWNEGVEDETCPVCFLTYSEEAQDVATINHCGHTYHESCLQQAVSYMGSRCPVCRVPIYDPVGKMPSGTMRISVDPNMSCTGYPKGTLVITYNIPEGIQKVYHMNPGERHCSTERIAFLPLVEEGLELLVRLKYAFKHGMMFDVGTSLTTGRKNVVVWNSIHHKTSISGGAHGWPDPAYFLNCNEELDALGVPQPEELN